jgi:ADP-ribose pyrophosphatase
MSDLTERQLSTEQIYSGRVISLHVDEVILPNGQQSTREIVRHPGAVAIVPIDSSGRVVMVEQYRYAAQRTMLEIPAGTLKLGEDPDLCAERELQEETGYKPGKLTKLGSIFLAPGYSTEQIHLYLATDLTESRLAMDEDEFINVHTLSFDDIHAQIASNAICDAKTIAAISLANASR